MGCLNSTGQFDHWFVNIHFSGPCNRACYFCIGQHVPGVDPINNLDAWPLPGLDRFVAECKAPGVREVNLTGSDTDPLLYGHLGELCAHLQNNLPDVKIGIRTNGVNVVLCPETVGSGDLWNTLIMIASHGIKRVNIREPYGQSRIGDPLAQKLVKWGKIFGMPQYKIGDTIVTYWDVHYVEVESVNLYANGHVSVTYPVTKGHDPQIGTVMDQTNFKSSGRQSDQWKQKRKLVVMTA